MHDALPFLDRAEQHCPQPTQEAGLNFCRGLYEWYGGNPNNALRYFNNARRSSEWGHQAICNMVEICLNPDNDLPNEIVQDTINDDVRIFNIHFHQFNLTLTIFLTFSRK